ncbi:hypothetical protein PROVRETT_09500 [Providencia rettgeri DSM 1131]|nr:hypothetical protein PROVRETT_09500 [Providencia rettgeri DSM 1131]
MAATSRKAPSRFLYFESYIFPGRLNYYQKEEIEWQKSVGCNRLPSNDKWLIALAKQLY